MYYKNKDIRMKKKNNSISLGKTSLQKVESHTYLVSSVDKIGATDRERLNKSTRSKRSIYGTRKWKENKSSNKLWILNSNVKTITVTNK